MILKIITNFLSNDFNQKIKSKFCLIKNVNFENHN